MAAPIPLAPPVTTATRPLEVGHDGVLSSVKWIDMDLGSRACAFGPLTGEHGADLVQADGGGDERPRIDRPSA